MAIRFFNLLRKLTMASLAIACGTLAYANDPVNIPPVELKKAELTYKDTFGTSHEKAIKTTKLAEKSEFAKKLFDAHQKSANDPALQEVLRKHALLFAQPTDPVGLAVATDVYKVYLTFPSRRPLALEKLAALQERGLPTEPVVSRPKMVADVIKGYRDAAAEYEKQGNATAATAVIGKARIVARKYSQNDREIFAALDNDERRLSASAADQAETERFRSAVAKNPEDSKSRVALASRYLRYNRNREAAELLQGAGVDWAAVAAALEAKPVDALALSRGLLKAVPGVAVEDKKTRYFLMNFARGSLEDFRNGHAEKWPDAIPVFASVLELLVANEPTATLGQNVTPLVLALIEYAEQLTGKFDYTEASNVLVRARAISKTAKAGEIKELQADLDSAERVVKACITLDLEIAQWKSDEAKAALDAKGNLAYGVALLRAGRIPESVKRLEKCSSPVFVALAQLLAKGEQATNLAVADSLRTAAAELQGNEKTDLLALARTWYERYLESNPKDSPEKTRIQLLTKELPLSTRAFTTRDYVELFDENILFVQKMIGGLATGGSTATPEQKDVFRGKLALKVRPDCLTVADMGWNFTICEHPKKANEFRYASWAWKKVGEHSATIQFFDSAGNGHLYISGKQGNGSERTIIRRTMPIEWTNEIRDVFEDHGPMVIKGFQAWPLIGDYMLIDAIYLSKSKASLERLAARK